MIDAFIEWVGSKIGTDAKQTVRRQYNANGGMDEAPASAAEVSKTKKFIKNMEILGVLLIVCIILWNMCTYTVSESNQAIVSRFGKMISVTLDKDNVKAAQELQADPRTKHIAISTSKGLKFKMPLIDSVDRYTTRLLTYETPARQVTTADKKKLVVDSNSQWVIYNPVTFKMSMGNAERAAQRIDDTLYSSLNEKISKSSADKVISDAKVINSILDMSKAEVNTAIAPYGVEVKINLIRHTGFPDSVTASIFANMKSEREQMAAKYIAEGEEEYLKLTSNADKEVAVMMAEAQETAKKIIAEGEQEAAATYNTANAADPEFYEYYMTMQTYKNSLKTGTKLVLTKDSPLGKFMFTK